MIINKITTNLDLNYWLKSFDTASLEATNQKSIKLHKDFEPTNETSWFKYFGYQNNYQSSVPTLPDQI